MFPASVPEFNSQFYSRSQLWNLLSITNMSTWVFGDFLRISVGKIEQKCHGHFNLTEIVLFGLQKSYDKINPLFKICPSKY